MDTSVSGFRVFSMFLLVMGVLLEKGLVCRGLDLRLFDFLFCFCIGKASMFFSPVHMFHCRLAGAMGVILPLSLAKRLALQVLIAKFI